MGWVKTRMDAWSIRRGVGASAFQPRRTPPLHHTTRAPASASRRTPNQPTAQSNYLGHFELANRLVRHVQRQRGLRGQQPQQAPRQQGQRSQRPLRVLFLSSMTHAGADLASSPAAWADLPHCRRSWHPFQAYCNSKVAAERCQRVQGWA